MCRRNFIAWAHHRFFDKNIYVGKKLYGVKKNFYVGFLLIINLVSCYVSCVGRYFIYLPTQLTWQKFAFSKTIFFVSFSTLSKKPTFSKNPHFPFFLKKKTPSHAWFSLIPSLHQTKNTGKPLHTAYSPRLPSASNNLRLKFICFVFLIS